MFGGAAGGPERSGGPPSAHRHTYRPRFQGQVRLRTAQLRPSAGCPAYEPADRGEEEATDRGRPDQHSHRHTHTDTHTDSKRAGDRRRELIVIARTNTVTDTHTYRHIYRQQEGRGRWRKLSGLSGPTQTRTDSVKLERLYWTNLTRAVRLDPGPGRQSVTPGTDPSVPSRCPSVHLSICPRCGGSSVPLQMQLPAEAMARRRTKNVYISRRG